MSTITRPIGVRTERPGSHIMTITWLTFHEARRRRMVLIALALGVLFIALYALGLGFIVSQAQQTADASGQNVGLSSVQSEVTLGFLSMAGLYVVHFLSIMLAIFASVDTISGEITSHTIQAIATKPVRRWEIIIGKWLGQSAMLVPYMAFLSLGVIGTIWLFTGYVPQSVPQVVGLVVLQALVFLSLSLLGGTRLSTLTNGVGLFMLYGLAFIGSWIEQIGSLLNSKGAIDLGVITSLIVPVEALWRLAAGLLSPTLSSYDSRIGILFGAGSQPSGWMVAYAIAYALVVLGLAVRSFSRRDL